MGNRNSIDWTQVAGEVIAQVRPETASKYFPRNPLRRFIINNFLNRVEFALSSFPWQNLLDVGCGEGFVDYFLGQRFPGRKITGVDQDAAALAVARRNVPALEFPRG